VHGGAPAGTRGHRQRDRDDSAHRQRASPRADRLHPGGTGLAGLPTAILQQSVVKLFTHIASAVSQLQETGVQKGVFAG